VIRGTLYGLPFECISFGLLAQHHRGKLDGKPPLADPALESGAATDDHACECVVLYGTKVLQTQHDRGKLDGKPPLADPALESRDR